ncbi:MAG TPA: hypothetical protein DIW43_13815 [Spongiibacteraceae bacterium]|nr:hypothetical protein [Spongiibacteraceae bacterium]HCS28532.1 hypothetical protein [Spongiibacteraceae bacterium]|tara:strand:- start:1028 stop:2218 length:1191 start_codon:yes stop_codon:yes gene_type:complete
MMSAEGKQQASARPALVPGEHVLIITQVNPYTPVGGVTVVMRNLLSAFDTRSYTIAYLGRFNLRQAPEEYEPREECYRLIPNFHPVQLLGAVFARLKQRYATWRAIRLAKAKGAGIVVGLYPTFASLRIATDVAERLGARYFPYLHDTVLEGLSHTAMADDAATLQQRVFSLATKVMTMSEGMTDYYKDKYQLVSYPLEHSYPEAIESQPEVTRTKTAFWGGEVYAINDQSFSRVQQALEKLDTNLEVTSLSSLRIESASNVVRNFYPSRDEYIQAVRHHGILVLAINWPDESDVHEAELSTIFPTKTVEYLATGSPILVHCPEHYFLARFFRERNCGVVVSSRDQEQLLEGIERLQNNPAETLEMQRNALEATSLFGIDRVAGTFQEYLKAEPGR